MKNLAWKTILVTFAVSFVLGTLFGRWEFSNRMHRKWKDPEARQRWVLKRMDSSLDLNADQEAKISAILKEVAPRMKAVRAKMKPELNAIKRDVRTKIMPLLTPEQQAKYDAVEKGWQARREKFRSG